MILHGQTPAADPIESKQPVQEKYDPEDPDLKPVEPINNQYVDPFAHEESSEVKYKTLKWWYVLIILPFGNGIKLKIRLGNVECVCCIRLSASLLRSDLIQCSHDCRIRLAGCPIPASNPGYYWFSPVCHAAFNLQ